MAAVLRAGLEAKYVRFGDTILRQVEGLPIGGGGLSDVGANIVLTVQEATWRSHLLWRMLAVLRSAAECSTMAACTRYVDDVLAISTHLCLGCLEAMVVLRHPGVPFSATKASVGWLDVVVHPRDYRPTSP